MKTFRAFLAVLILIGISPVSYASVNTGFERETISVVASNQEESMILASNSGLQAGLENQMVASGITFAKPDNSIPVSTVGIIFASLLLGAGLLVGPKKKAKSNTVVGVVAKSN